MRRKSEELRRELEKERGAEWLSAEQKRNLRIKLLRELDFKEEKEDLSDKGICCICGKKFEPKNGRVLCDSDKCFKENKNRNRNFWRYRARYLGKTGKPRRKEKGRLEKEMIRTGKSYGDLQKSELLKCMFDLGEEPHKCSALEEKECEGCRFKKTREEYKNQIRKLRKKSENKKLKIRTINDLIIEEEKENYTND